MKIDTTSWKQVEKHKIICLQIEKVDNFETLNSKLINSN